MENKKNSILIVDDHAKNIQVLANLLSEQDYEIEYAMNGKDALSLIDSEDFDLVLLDIMMPEMDGYEVCQRIKNKSETSEIPIIFLSAKTDQESLQKGFMYGANDYINKPFNSQELLARVGLHIELKKSKDQLQEVNSWLEEKVEQRTKELKQANEKLQDLDDAKNHFLQIISHEIRTPLNGILGGLSMIKEESLSEDALVFMDMLDRSATRLEEFSYKALDISQVTLLGNKMLQIGKENINSIISNVSSSLLKEINAKELQISKTININHEIVNIDKDYFSKVIFSVLQNAIFYSPNKAEISIYIMQRDEQIIIEIKDQGEGFAAHYSIQEMAPFSNEQHVDRKAGLSLYLSYQIMKAHGGFMENENNKTGGACVRIVLPLK